MAKAEEYRICCALFSAYIAKVSKRNHNIMLGDRREITNSEILTLINWKLKDWVSRNECSEGFIFEDNNGKKIEVHYLNEIKK